MPKNKPGGKAKKVAQKQQGTVKSVDTPSVVYTAEVETVSPDVDTSSVPEDPYLKVPVVQTFPMGAKASTEAVPEKTSTSGKAFEAEEKEDTDPNNVDTSVDMTSDAIFQDVESPGESRQAKTEFSQDPPSAANVIGETEPSKQEAVEKVVSHAPLDIETETEELDIADEDKAPAPQQSYPPLTPIVRHEDTYPSIAEDEENVDYYMPEKENLPLSPSHLQEDAAFDAIFKDIYSPAPSYIQKKPFYTFTGTVAELEEEDHDRSPRAATPKAYLSPEPSQQQPAIVKGLQILEEDDRSHHSYTAIAEDILGSFQSRAAQFLSGDEVFDLSKTADKIDSFFAGLSWPIRMFIPAVVWACMKYWLLWNLLICRTAYHVLCTMIKLYLFLALLPLRCLEKGLEWSFQLSVYVTVWFLNRVPGGHKIPTALNGHVEK